MRIVIVEDESRAAKRLGKLLRENWNDRIQSLKTCIDLPEAKELIETDPIDLLFLDLDLNGESGFDLLKHAVAESFFTIIVSAHTDKAVTAFEYGVLDFVSKPVIRERLNLALQRCFARKDSNRQPMRFFATKRRGSVTLVPVAEIAYVQGAGIYSELVHIDGTRSLYEKTLDQLEVLLSGDFVRIHRSYIVPIAGIQRLHVLEGTRYLVDLANGTTLPVGRTRISELRSLLV